MKLSNEAVDAIAASHARMNDRRFLAVSSRHPGVPQSGATVTMLYKNWRGHTAVRTVVIERHWYGSTEWHPEQQDMFTAYEIDTGKTRDFAVAGVKDWDAGE